MKVLCANEGFVSNFELLELLRQRTQEPGHTPSYPQPHDPFPTELQVKVVINVLRNFFFYASCPAHPAELVVKPFP